MREGHDHYKLAPAYCKKCNSVMHFDILDYGATFICPKCETEHTFREMIASYSDWYADTHAD